MEMVVKYHIRVLLNTGSRSTEDKVSEHTGEGEREKVSVWASEWEIDWMNERRDVFAFAKHDTMHNHILTDLLPDRATIDCIRKTFHLVNGYALPSATFQW